MQVQRKELLHFYVQSKPVNDVVYGQVVFDKAVLAANILKEGPMKVIICGNQSYVMLLGLSRLRE